MSSYINNQWLDFLVYDCDNNKCWTISNISNNKNFNEKKKKKRKEKWGRVVFL